MLSTRTHPERILRFALLADAAASGLVGLVLAAAAGPLSAPLGLPEPLLRGAGLVLLPYAALVAWAGTRLSPPPGLVRAIVALNLLWAADSVLLLALGPWLGLPRPGALGVALVLAQALAVAGFAAVQGAALRRLGGPKLNGPKPALA